MRGARYDLIISTLRTSGTHLQCVCLVTDHVVPDDEVGECVRGAGNPLTGPPSHSKGSMIEFFFLKSDRQEPNIDV